MQIRLSTEFFFDLAWRKAFVRNDDPSPDIVITDRCWIAVGIDTVLRKDFRTDRFHPFNIIGVENGYFADTHDPGLAGEGGQVIDLAVVLL